MISHFLLSITILAALFAQNFLKLFFACFFTISVALSCIFESRVVCILNQAVSILSFQYFSSKYFIT